MQKEALLQYVYDWLGDGAASKTASDISEAIFKIVDSVPAGVVGHFNDAAMGPEVRDDITKLSILLLGYFTKVESANTEAAEIMDILSASGGNAVFSGGINASGDIGTSGNVSASGDINASGVVRAGGLKLATLQQALNYDAFNGGRSLRDQTNNTICRIGSLRGNTPADDIYVSELPDDLHWEVYYDDPVQGHIRVDRPADRYAWLLTMGNANTNQMQMLIVSSYHVIYTRFCTWNSTTSTKTWTPWVIDMVNMHFAPFKGTKDGVTALRNQPCNTCCWIPNLGVITMLSDVPPELLTEDKTEVRPYYAFLETTGIDDENRLQKLYLTNRKAVYHRFCRKSGNDYSWTSWYSSSSTQTPNYVAIGASTTWGAVKHPNGTDHPTRSDNRYPSYISEALGLQLVDLSQGTIGFVYRAGSTQRRNFMDRIFYSGNKEAFEKAGLITLQFAYGNDGAAGLPVGKYDDYYPYDEPGYHPSINNPFGPEDMVKKGATWFGCLNWCVRYIGEHFPRAQLVLIFGAPSANQHRRTYFRRYRPVELKAGDDPYYLSLYELTDNYRPVAAIQSDNPYRMGWYEYGSGNYAATGDRTVDAGKTYYEPEYAATQDREPVEGKTYYESLLKFEQVAPAADANPSVNGWYEYNGTDYIRTKNEEVVSGKAYFRPTAEFEEVTLGDGENPKRNYWLEEVLPGTENYPDTSKIYGHPNGASWTYTNGGWTQVTPLVGDEVIWVSELPQSGPSGAIYTTASVVCYHYEGARWVTKLLNSGEPFYIHRPSLTFAGMTVYDLTSDGDIVDGKTYYKRTPPYRILFRDAIDTSNSNDNMIALRQIRAEMPKLKTALNIPLIDMYSEECCFSEYQSNAIDSTGRFALLSTQVAGSFEAYTLQKDDTYTTVRRPSDMLDDLVIYECNGTYWKFRYSNDPWKEYEPFADDEILDVDSKSEMTDRTQIYRFDERCWIFRPDYTLDTHPNDAGYEMFARWVAGVVIRQFKHK